MIPIPLTFAVLDFEFTGQQPDAHVVEWAAVILDEQGYEITRTDALVRPPVPISPETSAVHQIIDSDVTDAPAWSEELDRIRALVSGDHIICVAHSAETESGILTPAGVVKQWICSYKSALRVWPESPVHSNEGLRYWLGHGTGRNYPQRPHSALHDASVTATIFRDLLCRVGVSDMLQWTREPAMLPRCPLGDWRGHPWSDVDEGFLHWILRKIFDREDVRFCAQMELDRREAEWRAKQQEQAEQQQANGRLF